MIKEIITITKISGTNKRNVSYSGSRYFDGCDISNFPTTPEIGKKYILISDFENPSIVLSCENNVSYSE